MAQTELHAAGFNAWNQVIITPETRRRNIPKEEADTLMGMDAPPEPEDVHKFTALTGRLFSDVWDVESFLSYTLGK